MYFPGCSRRVGERHSSWDGFYGKFDDLQRRDRGRLRDAHTFRAGAALFTLVSAYEFASFTEAALESGGSGIQFDPTRIVATGVEAIIHQGTDIRGLTATASLWAAAAIGVAVGARFLFGAASTTVVALLSLLRKLRSLIIPHLRTDYGILSLTFDESVSNIMAVSALLDRHDIDVRSLDAELEDGQSHYSIRVRIPPSRNAQDVPEEITTLPGVRRVGVSGLRDID